MTKPIAVTPNEALVQSPAAQLDPEERISVEREIFSINVRLGADFNGGATPVEIEQVTRRALMRIVRVFEQAGWTVQIQGAKSAIAASPEQVKNLVEQGAAVNWVVVFVPRWRTN